mmetsp:Transcript_63161/g.137317  ORF Transcript_63161/g.137317 Transcript_63161/m.137317 type:complete len:288 (-) Transcript_63161:149-1012(-)
MVVFEFPQHQVNLGWGDEGSNTIGCRARMILPTPSFLPTCCWPCENTDWLPVQVSVEVLVDSASSRPVETLLRCERRGSGSSGLGLRVVLPLSRISSLSRLCLGGPGEHGDSLPGLELRVTGKRSRLQLMAAGAVASENRSTVARFQLLHAFLAAVAEGISEANPDSEVRRVEPLEWPHEDGRRASLAYLASVLRGVEVVEPVDVLRRARFAGPACPVCMELWGDLSRDRPAVVLSCGHAFCEQCLGQSVAHSRASCPTCRSNFEPRSGIEANSQEVRRNSGSLLHP